jgi:hypothetical protein
MAFPFVAIVTVPVSFPVFPEEPIQRGGGMPERANGRCLDARKGARVKSSSPRRLRLKGAESGEPTTNRVK